MRVLVVEDDPGTSGMLSRGLVGAGYAVDVAASGEEALRLADPAQHRAVVLDVGLVGDLDGISVCRELRRREFWGAVVMLTGRGAVEDRVRGLDAGADDYVVKPFTVAELAARLRAQTRRPDEPRPTVLTVGELRLDPGSREVWRGRVLIDLTPRELGVFAELMRHPGQVLTRDALLDLVWDEPFSVASNVVDQTVRYLRRKVDDPFGARDIETVRGVGYRLRG